MCNCLLDFLTGRAQAVWLGNNTYSTIPLNTGAPQGCVFSPLLFILLTHDCTPTSSSNSNDETTYTSEVSRLAMKTEDILVDFRRVQTQNAPLTIKYNAVEQVSSTKFLDVHITQDLTCHLQSCQDCR